MALGGLKDALEDRVFFYAWCIDCGFAKRAYERVCCNEGQLPPIQDFRCQDCNLVLETRLADEGRRRIEKASQKQVRITQCPECKAYVEKVSSLGILVIVH